MGQQCKLRTRWVIRMVALAGFLSGGPAGADEPVPKPGLVSATPVTESVPASSSAPSTIPAPVPAPGPSGPTLPAAEPPASIADSPAPVVLPRAIIVATSVELFHPESGQLLATIPIQEGWFAFFQRSDLLYLAHRNSFSVLNLRTQVVREVKTPLSNWKWEHRDNLLILRGSDGRSVFYDLTDPANPAFLRLAISDGFFQDVRALNPVRGSNPVVVSKQPRGTGLISAGSILIGTSAVLTLASVYGLEDGLAMSYKLIPNSSDSGGAVGLLSGSVGIAGSALFLGIPGAIMLGVGEKQRHHLLPVKATKLALLHDRNAIIAGAVMLLTGITLDLSLLCNRSEFQWRNGQRHFYGNTSYPNACDRWSPAAVYAGPLLTTVGVLILPIAGSIYATHQFIIDAHGSNPTRPTALAPLDISVTPYASTTDFGLMATGRF